MGLAVLAQPLPRTAPPLPCPSPASAWLVFGGPAPPPRFSQKGSDQKGIGAQREGCFKSAPLRAGLPWARSHPSPMGKTDQCAGLPDA